MSPLTERDALAASATEEDLAHIIPETVGACSELFHRLGMGPKPEPQDSCRYMARHDVSKKLRYWARYQHADMMLKARQSAPTPEARHE